MLYDARELADEIDIPANFELTQPRHRVRRRNVDFDYEAREDPNENPTLKYKTEFYFFTLEIKLSMHLNPDVQSRNLIIDSFHRVQIPYRMDFVKIDPKWRCGELRNVIGN
ncbi:uncharacterized protein TNCV_3095951 [Trichonephila clavipes]|nr:uncharacterized protein TNCV_3095951 [Trichonephila clavipes]